MAGSTTSGQRPSRRDRDTSRRNRDKDRDGSKRDTRDRDWDSGEVVRYARPRSRDGRPVAPHRRSTTHNDDDDDGYSDRDDDRSYRRPSSDTKRRGGGGGGGGRRPRSETRSSETRDGRDRDRDRDRERLSSQDRAEESKKKRNQAIKAALTAGAFEAMRQKNRPGEWIGEKGVRVATAAISAAVIDTGLDKNPNRGAVGNIMKSTIGGLIIDKIANGGKR